MYTDRVNIELGSIRRVLPAVQWHPLYAVGTYMHADELDLWLKTIFNLIVPTHSESPYDKQAEPFQIYIFFISLVFLYSCFTVRN